MNKKLAIYTTAIFTAVATPAVSQDFGMTIMLPTSPWGYNPLSTNPKHMYNPQNLYWQNVINGLAEEAIDPSDNSDLSTRLNAITQPQSNIALNEMNGQISDIFDQNLALALSNPYFPPNELSELGLKAELTPFVAECREEIANSANFYSVTVDIVDCLSTKFEAANNIDEAPNNDPSQVSLSEEELDALRVRCFRRDEDGHVLASPENTVRASGEYAWQIFNSPDEYMCGTLQNLPARYRHLSRQ